MFPLKGPPPEGALTVGCCGAKKKENSFLPLEKEKILPGAKAPLSHRSMWGEASFFRKIPVETSFVKYAPKEKN